MNASCGSGLEGLRRCCILLLGDNDAGAEINRFPVSVSSSTSASTSSASYSGGGTSSLQYSGSVLVVSEESRRLETRFRWVRPWRAFAVAIVVHHKPQNSLTTCSDLNLSHTHVISCAKPATTKRFSAPSGSGTHSGCLQKAISTSFPSVENVAR
uniref:Uncharacterized protein n=1 Tax=Mycena chlorophos TaxID=658473 RepID=A0ABQ0LVF2_MYCCL|nr:predicted protein [Mycena chlorophos]